VLQAVLVYTQDLPRVLELAEELGIEAVAVYEAMRGAQDDA